MSLGLLDEGRPVTVSRPAEEWVSGVAVVEGNLTRRLRLLLKEACRPFPVSRMLSVMAVIVAYALGYLAIALPPQIFLHRHGARAVARALVGHHLFGSHYH